MEGLGLDGRIILKKRPHGRPRLRWKNNIKMHIKQI
jgi:hypothetical protein